jgi:hypothetical protein
MVKREGLVDKLVVKADGNGQVGHAGSGVLAGVADRVGLTGALSAAMGSTRQRRSAHNPGVVLRDLVVMLADGGGCLADLGALRDQVDLDGHVASDSTAFRVIDSIDEQGLDGLRGAVAVSRARAWKLGARPERSVARWHSRSERTVLDIDATLTTVHSEKEQAHGNFKGGYGHHPLLCYLDGTGEAPAGILRAGNAGSAVFLSSRQNGRIFQPNAGGCSGAGSRVFGASSEVASVLGSAGVRAGGRPPQKRPSSPEGSGRGRCS